MDDRVLDLVSDLSDPAQRAGAAERLAKSCGGEALLFFVRDTELDVLVPAPGLPQTIPGGPLWRAFLSRCRGAGVGMVKGDVAFPGRQDVGAAVALTSDCGLVAVLIGGQPKDDVLDDLRRGLRVLSAIFRSEQAVAAARGAGAVARDQAQHAHSLSVALETARSSLERVLGEEARLNRELQHADRIKDEFLATLAHELRNPLAALSGGIHLARTKLASDHPAADAIAVAVRQAERLARLIDDLMDVSRITHGKIELQTEPLAVDQIVERAVESVRAHVEARQHEVKVRSIEGPFWIAADALRVEQIVTNLLTNAVKYTDPGGLIEVVVETLAETADEHESVCLTVKDNGIGISPAALPKVFELFRQIEPSEDRSQGGLGIGLTLVRKLVEMQGGKVTMSSKGLGYGTTVTVCFPSIAPPAPARERPEAFQRLSASATFRCRVLIVDDNDDAAELLAELVTLWGHDSRVVNDGATAVTESQLFKPNVILLDIGLPDMTGYEVASRIRQRQVKDAPVIVALTGYGQPTDRQRTEEAGFDKHFTKPVDMAKLQDLLGTVAAAAPSRLVFP